MARSRDLPSSTFADELRHLERAYFHTGLAFCRHAVRAWALAVRDFTEDGFGRDCFRQGPNNLCQAFMRGVRTYCLEMTAVSPRAVDGLTQDADSAKRKFIDPRIQEPANMQHVVPSISRRRVQLLIVDADPKVPTEKCIVWESDVARLTDLTDEELWFEEALNSAPGITEALKNHNKWRSGLAKPLEEVRFRDLQKKVVTIARF
jgi:hypothetical protein